MTKIDLMNYKARFFFYLTQIIGNRAIGDKADSQGTGQFPIVWYGIWYGVNCWHRSEY